MLLAVEHGITIRGSENEKMATALPPHVGTFFVKIAGLEIKTTILKSLKKIILSCV